MSDGQFVTFVIVITLVIFLLLREFWCWYWKINKINTLLEEITIELKRNSTTIECLLNQDNPSNHNKGEQSIHKTDKSVSVKPIEVVNNNIQVENETVTNCGLCKKEILGTLYCPNCDKFFCYSCMTMMGNCPICKEKLVEKSNLG